MASHRRCLRRLDAGTGQHAHGRPAGADWAAPSSRGSRPWAVPNVLAARQVVVRVAGDALIGPSITRRLIAEFAARRDPAVPPAALGELTDREREILSLVAQGLSNAEIAGQLVSSPLTAKTHVSNVLR